ncbi:MAG TPA: HTTM domain-containing protein, partial [Lacipirellulaceae bacterium]|nr:HTTM domain-containing protein [Lacipirellulaceae bacterium]
NDVPPSTGANFAIRLIQLHMCVIYLFSAMGKLQGETWWTGDAVWYSVATLEYQSIDMTWLWHYPWLVNLLTHGTVAFELLYPALIWPRLTRPWVLLMAVLVHGGIALFLGMPTFGLVMLIGNLAFISPKTVRKIFDPIARRISLAVVGKASRAGGAD